MPSVKDAPETPADPSLPPGTETVVWAGAGTGSGAGFHLANPRRYADALPDDLDLEENEDGLQPTIVFAPGEELPLPVARDQWEGWSDCMAAFDGDGDRLDTPSRRENEHAIESWRRQRR